MNLTKQFERSIKKGGLILMLVRLPRQVITKIREKINVWYWSYFLGTMGKNVQIGVGVKIDIPRNVFIGDNVRIGSGVVIGAENLEGKLYLENNVQINRDCLIDHSGDVVIGSHTLLSAEVTVLSHTHNYDPRSPSNPVNKKIGPGCWIGYRVFIGEMAQSIGENSIIAASSVVVKSCEQPGMIYAGIPAKPIRKISEQSS